ncbi:hypothetical protein TNCV_280491 [Trichonephila clavipes]|nr:hypothetical protein TNCV_280491 [Trichonephila clavipes]
MLIFHGKSTFGLPLSSQQRGDRRSSHASLQLQSVPREIRLDSQTYIDLSRLTPRSIPMSSYNVAFHRSDLAFTVTSTALQLGSIIAELRSSKHLHGCQVAKNVANVAVSPIFHPVSLKRHYSVRDKVACDCGVKEID